LTGDDTGSLSANQRAKLTAGINPKLQNPSSNPPWGDCQAARAVWNLVIGAWGLFGIWVLEFGISAGTVCFFQITIQNLFTNRFPCRNFTVNNFPGLRFISVNIGSNAHRDFPRGEQPGAYDSVHEDRNSARLFPVH
jgi:hypothetical protein